MITKDGNVLNVILGFCGQTSVFATIVEVKIFKGIKNMSDILGVIEKYEKGAPTIYLDGKFTEWELIELIDRLRKVRHETYVKV